MALRERNLGELGTTLSFFKDSKSFGSCKKSAEPGGWPGQQHEGT